MVKKIYIKSLLAIFSVLILQSCAVDDDPAITANLNESNYIQFEESGNINYVSQSDLKIKIDKASDTESKVEYTVTQTADDGTVTTLEEGQVIIPAGEKEVFINIDGVVLGNSTITLSDAVGLNHPDVKLGENKSIDLFTLPAASEDSVVVAMVNSDNSTDLWLGASRFSSTGAIWRADYVGSANFQTPRIANIPLTGVGTLGTIPNSSAIAPDVLALNLYPQAELSATVDYQIYITMPDGSSQEFIDQIPGARAVDNAVVKIVAEEDPASPGNKTYTFSSF